MKKEDLVVMIGLPAVLVPLVILFVYFVVFVRPKIEKDLDNVETA